MARHLSIGFILVVAAVPVTVAFGCGYWTGLGAEKKRTDLPEEDREVEYGDEQTLDNVCGLCNIQELQIPLSESGLGALGHQHSEHQAWQRVCI